MPTSESAAAPAAPGLTISDLAVAKVRELVESQGLGADESFLRIYVAGQSCAGPAFGLAFDEAHEDDVRVDVSGLGIVIDPMSLPYLQGGAIDFVETAEVTGFKVSTPNDGAACSSGSCGSSDEDGCPPACG